MTIKSISYECIISSLIDACALIDNRTDGLSIKKSFSAKQDTYSHVLYDRLLTYISGEDRNLRVVIGNFFEVLEEVMKAMGSSPLLLDMSKETYNDEFKHNLIIPFTAVLLFNMRSYFNETSPVCYIIDFISKISLTVPISLDACIREYIRASLKSCNLPGCAGTEFKDFIGKISLESTFKLQTAKIKLDELKEECECIDDKNRSIEFNKLSLSLHGMHLVLYFRDYIKELIYFYGCADKNLQPEDGRYWVFISEIVRNFVIPGKTKICYQDLIKTTSMVEEFSDCYYKDLSRRYNKLSDDVFDYHLYLIFEGNELLSYFEDDEYFSSSIQYKILDIFRDLYNAEFDLVLDKAKVVISECEKYPPCLLVSHLASIVIALTIKARSLKIKNNSLNYYICKVISMDWPRYTLTSECDIAFTNKNSLFSNSVVFYTIITSLSYWNYSICPHIRVDAKPASLIDVEFTEKIECSLSKIYNYLDSNNLDLSLVSDNELKMIVKSTLTTSELMENIITFIPNLSLYFALREINFIFSSVSLRVMAISQAVVRFIGESSDSKKKLLKAINLSEYVKDEKNEKMLQENSLT